MNKNNVFISYNLFLLILWNCRVNLVRPRRYAALQIDQSSLKPGVLQITDSLRTSHTALALHNGGFTGLDLGDAVDNLAERYKLRIRDAGKFILVRLANVDYLQIGLLLDPPVQLGRGNFLKLRFCFRHIEAAKCFIIDELPDRRVFAAKLATRIFAQL